jgi:hypothetical protein
LRNKAKKFFQFNGRVSDRMLTTPSLFLQESIGIHVRTTNLPACFIKAGEADTCGLAIVIKRKKVAS